jgi:hypothetical protein
MAKSRTAGSTSRKPRKPRKATPPAETTLTVALEPSDGTHVARCRPKDMVRLLSVVDGFYAHGLPREKIVAVHRHAQQILIGAAAALHSLDREEGKAPQPDPSVPTVRREWDDIALDIAGLAPLLHVIEEHLTSLGCDMPMGEMSNFTAGDVAMLAGLARRRLDALDERMCERRPANDCLEWDR